VICYVLENLERALFEGRCMKFVLPLKGRGPLALRFGLGVFTLSVFGCGAKTNTENATGGAKRVLQNRILA
jgi:hypothetical protein